MSKAFPNPLYSSLFLSQPVVLHLYFFLGLSCREPNFNLSVSQLLYLARKTLQLVRAVLVLTNRFLVSLRLFYIVSRVV